MRIKNLFSAIKRNALMYGRNSFLFVIDGIFINAAIILTTSAFLTGFFVEINASDFVIGIVNTAYVWAPVTALFSSFIYAKLKNIKRFLIILNLISRFLVCFIVFLPIVLRNNAVLVNLAMIMVITGYIFWSIYSVGSNIWMMSSMPRTIRPAFVYRRMICLRISYTITSIVMGFVLDQFTDRILGFIVVFMISMLFSVLDVLVLTRIPYDNESGRVRDVNTMVPSLLLAPFKDKVYNRFLIFIFVFYLSVYTSYSYTSLYLLKYMKFPYGFVSIVYVVSYIASIMSVMLWRAIEKKKGTVFAFRCTAVVYLMELFLYFFLFNQNVWIPLIAGALSGIGTGGLNIIVFTYRYEIMPEDNCTNYETWFMVIQGLAIMLGPIIGGTVRPLLQTFNFAGTSISNFQQMYLISVIIGGAAIPLCLKMNKKRILEK